MKQKILNNLKKCDNILIIIIFAIMISGVSLFIKVQPNDELWNFANIYKMTNGFKIYTDLNIIITPLFFYLAQIFFNIFGANILSFRMFNILIYTGLIFIIYNLFKTFKISKSNSILYTLLVYSLIYITIPAGANYNILALLFYILGITLIIRNKFSNNINSLIQGIIIFLIFITKQNIGVLYILGVILYKILLNNNWKKTIIDLFKQLSVSAILLVISLFYLYLNGNLYDFFNYTVLGIGEFAQKNIFVDWSCIIYLGIQVCLLSVMIFIIKSKKLNIDNQFKNNILILFSFSTMSVFMAYPMFNTYHISMSIVVVLISMIYIVNNVIKDFLNIPVINKLIKVLLMFLIIFNILISMLYLSYWINMLQNSKYSKYTNIYYGGIIEQETEQDINEICRYIQSYQKNGIDVKIISYKANLYMAPLNKSNKDMDLPFLGNMGKEGEQGMIKKIKNLKNTHILLTKESIVIQESSKVIEYIKENLQRIGEIRDFDIYLAN